MAFRIAVLASGSGSNFQALIDRFKSHPQIKIALLIASKQPIGAIARATQNGIPVQVLPSAKESPGAYEMMLQKCLTEARIDLVVLAGFLSLIPAVITKNYPKRIINIHPALLPDFGGKGFYGLNVHKAVIAAKRKESGCTVHFVSEEYDKGDIIAQRKVPVLAKDTPEELAKRILAEEHQLLGEVVEQILLPSKP